MWSVAGARRGVTQDIRDGDHVIVVQMEGYLESSGYGTLDDIWDSDGDGIHVRNTDAFQLQGHPPVTVAFPQGSDPIVVARMLRKMSDMLSGARGQDLARLGQLVDRLDYARRDVDGEVLIANHRRQREEEDHAQAAGSTAAWGAERTGS